MKLFYILLLSLTGLLISSPSIAQGSLDALDAKNGFQGAVFGSSISSYPNLTLWHSQLSEYNLFLVDRFDKDMYKNAKVYFYKFTSKVGDLNIGQPCYYFTNNRLSRITLEPNNYEGSELLKLYKSLYGSPKIEKVDGIKTYEWRGKKVSLSMTFTESFNDNPAFCFVRYISIRQVSKTANAINKARAKDL